MSPGRRPGVALAGSARLVVAEPVDNGGVRPPRSLTERALLYGAVLWSVFQLWVASPLPYLFGDGIWVFNNTDTRSAHLAFALLLALLAYPAVKRPAVEAATRVRAPLMDWLLALLGAGCALYLAVFAEDLAQRPGLPTDVDLAVAGVGLALLLEAARRTLGWPLVIVAILFLAYVFLGHLAPEVVAWKGAAFGRAMDQMWLTQEGVFGVALGVSTSMVFIFVLFGALLERSGAGSYFIWVTFSLLGHLRGGPAKAAVASSGMTGLMSGSSIANVVTTGTFTIPLMRRIGFSAEKAGAIEVASSTNGQLTPPIMGAAAFLMIEFVGVSYAEVITHALLPALIAYIALLYIVHLEACKAGMTGLPRRREHTVLQALFGFATVLVGLMALTAVVYLGFGWVKGVAGDWTPWIAVGGLAAAYLALLKLSVRYPDLDRADAIDVLPDIGPVVKSGLYFLLPVVLLVWCLTVERLSPGLSAFWATVMMIVVVVTHKPLRAALRGDRQWRRRWREGGQDLLAGLVMGARNMVGIGIATAVAGIVIGTVTLTGIGLVMTEFVGLVSGGSLFFMLLLTAGISLLLGMGLPTTANYIVVSSLMAPVIVTLGAQSGLVVPLIAVHLFVFYFGVLADATPPVGLAAYAAAAVSGGDPMRTGVQGFIYGIRTAVLPFMFIFNTELLMIGIESIAHAALVIGAAVLGMLLFAAAMQGYWLTKNKLWETAALLLVVWTLFRPGFWMNKLEPELAAEPVAKIYEIAAALPADAQIRLRVVGETLEGEVVDKVVMLPVGAPGSGEDRLRVGAGLVLDERQGRWLVDDLAFGGAAEKQQIDFGWEVTAVQVRNPDRPAKHWFYLPALLLLAVVYRAQTRRAARMAV